MFSPLLLRFIKAALTFICLFLALVLAPASLLGLGSILTLMGRLLGILSTGSPTLFVSLSAAIAFLWGLKVLLTSK